MNSSRFWQPKYFIGVDLGQKRDHTAIAIVEATESGLNLRYVERLDLETPYTAVARRVSEIARATGQLGKVTLVVDATGVGSPVIDLLKASGLAPIAVTITGGTMTSQSGGLVRVPKQELILTVVALVESGRLKIAADIVHSGTLVQELLGFKLRVNKRTRRASYAAGKQTIHDDLVLALALACWAGWGADRQASGPRSAA